MRRARAAGQDEPSAVQPDSCEICGVSSRCATAAAASASFARVAQYFAPRPIVPLRPRRREWRAGLAI